MNYTRLVCIASFAGYGFLLIISPLLLSVPGDRIPVYGMMICLGVLPALSKRIAHRIIAIILVFVAVALILFDFEQGQIHRVKRSTAIMSAYPTTAELRTEAKPHNN